jgi:type I restriction enzyme M protein
MLIDARQQFEKEPKSFGNKRNRITNAHRSWIEDRYREGWTTGYADDYVKIFHRDDFAFHKVSVVFWQTENTTSRPSSPSLTKKPLPPRT